MSSLVAFGVCAKFSQSLFSNNRCLYISLICKFFGFPSLNAKVFKCACRTQIQDKPVPGTYTFGCIEENLMGLCGIEAMRWKGKGMNGKLLPHFKMSR